MNENIHEIARPYGYNDMDMFDPYKCDGKCFPGFPQALEIMENLENH